MTNHHRNQRRRESENKKKPKVNVQSDYDIDETRAIYKDVIGRSPPKTRMNDVSWMTRKVDGVQDLMDDAEKLGYDGEYKEKNIKEFIRNPAKKDKYEFKKTDTGSKNVAEHILEGTFHWNIKIQPYIQHLDVHSETLTNENLKGEKVASNKHYEAILIEQSDELLKKQKQFIKKHPELKKHLASWRLTADTSLNLQSVSKGQSMLSLTS